MTKPENTEEAVARPEGHCADDKAWLEFSRQYAGQPRSYGDMTDFALANAVFMASRDDLSLIHYQTAAKERIRWLSLRLASAEARALKAEARLAEAVGALREVLSIWDQWGSLDSTDPDDRDAMEAARQALSSIKGEG